jgi:uncharacterized repeat protein (TIGR01451 family)
MRIERCLLGLVVAPALLVCAGDSVMRGDVPPEAPGGAWAPAVCFAPGTDPAYVQRVYGSLWGQGPEAAIVQLFQFDDGARWSATATNGGGLVRGAPTVLRWSVVPDGTQIPSGFAGDPAGPSNLRARLNGLYGSQAVWQPLIQQALDEWASETGTSYIFEPNDDGGAFTSPITLGALGQIGVRGDLRLSGRNIDGNSGILAFNWFPDSGDMVIDTNDTFYNTTTNGSLRLRNVLSHEHGHGLGIDHVCPINNTKLMEPFFSSSFTGPQLDDILAGNRGYGDNSENNDSTSTGTNLGGPLANGSYPLNNLSIDGSNDLDFVRFTVAAGRQIDVTVTPLGSTYQQGPQNQKGSCDPSTAFNALAQSNLALQVISTNGTTILVSGNAAGIGLPETLNNVVLPSAGEFFIRVSGSPDAVQLYNFALTVEGGQSVDLGITKTDGVASEVPGTSATYTIVATNLSTTLGVTGATVVDNFPAVFTGVTWTCAASSGSSCGAPSGSGNINQTVNLLPGGTATYTATGTIASTATGSLANTASVGVPSGFTDPVSANNAATDTDTLTPQANLGITKTDGLGTALPGNAVTYTITVTNAGPSAAAGATVADTFPAALTGVTWTCGASAGSTCGAPSGAGNIAVASTILPAGTVTFSATGTINPGATGTLANTATVTAPVGTTDPTPANNTATDTDTLAPTADLAVTKTDGQATAVPGAPVTYTIAVSSAGPSNSGSATVTDTFPAAITGVNWTCAATGGSTCPGSGTGNIAAAVSLAPGGVATFTATGTIAAGATGTLSNTATVTPAGGVADPAPPNNSATDTDTLTPQADLAITKTDGQMRVTPGAPVTYTIVVASTGPSQAPSATVSDTFPAAITGVNWTCTPAGGGSCVGSGSGNISSAVTLPPGASATFTATGTVSPGATGTLSNTASVAVGAGVTDPVAGNNAATDTDNISLDLTELTHGSRIVRDLRPVGVTPAEHFYWLSQKPLASYEVVADGLSGDVGPTLVLQRVAGDGTTVVQGSVGTSTIGASRSLRFANPLPVVNDSQLIRVRSGSCGSTCGADDVYRIRLRETTGRIPRFNNSTSQISIVILHNPSATSTVQAAMHFWRPNGSLAATQAVSIAPRSSQVFNSSSLPALAGASGSITVSHDGGYGGLVGKAVALESSTGFSFDSPMVPVAP